MRIGNRKKMKTETEEAYQLRMREYDRKALKESITTEAFSGVGALGWLGFIGGGVAYLLSMANPNFLSDIAPTATVQLVALITAGVGFSFVGLGQLICIR